ncbi:hypothetical protein V6C53_11290 [Desulfocurvibacter africanus]|uniref:hypothetical protein n=1 Tax=Desulfocurvibacter africanus TaxID=873 RepID=UPI002FD8F6EE
MKSLFKLYVYASLCGILLFYIFTDGSVGAVQNTSYRELIHLISLPSYNLSEEEEDIRRSKVDDLVKDMEEKAQLNADDSIEDLLQNNKHITEIKYSKGRKIGNAIDVNVDIIYKGQPIQMVFLTKERELTKANGAQVVGIRGATIQRENGTVKTYDTNAILLIGLMNIGKDI